MKYLILVLVVSLFAYSMVGTPTRVKEIKDMAPAELKAKGLEVIRYEGFQYGSWSRHGGKAWFFVKDSNRDNVYYKVSVSLWAGELQYYYGQPEKLLHIDHKSN